MMKVNYTFAVHGKRDKKIPKYVKIDDCTQCDYFRGDMYNILEGYCYCYDSIALSHGIDISKCCSESHALAILNEHVNVVLNFEW